MKALGITITLFLTILLMASSCFSDPRIIYGKGDLKKETRKLANFNGVEAGVSADVYIKIGTEYQVELEGQENVLALLKTEVKGNRLVIEFNKYVEGTKPLKIWVTAPSYNALELSGSGSLSCDEQLNSDKMELTLSGSGKVSINKGNFKQLTAELAGSGDLTVAGNSNESSFSVTGSGNLTSHELTSNVASCEVTGSGDITCNVSRNLTAEITGSGKVRYKGSPSIKSDVTGSGDVTPY